MYAIIKSGGKQYRVAQGDIIDVELLDAEEGAEIQFDNVLFFHNGKKASVGAPTVAKCIVKGKIVGYSSGPKITSVKYKPSHHQYRKFGHRQPYMRVEITAIG
ncbi:MAG: 50S ribosomal protein L21 [Parachlamydiaceae bacterium]|nr:50S ribosomal protein L21 [Parachlamydiaceae bacterium]